MEIKAVLLDFDGTLVDSMGIWRKIDFDFLQKRGKEVNDEYLRAVSTLPMLEGAEYTIKLYNLNEKAEDIAKEWQEMAIFEYGHNIKMKEGAERFLQKLKSEGIKTAIVTNLIPSLLNPAIKNNKIDKYIDAVCTTSEVSADKGEPDIFLLAAGKLGVLPENCLVIDDLPLGLTGAKKAGLKTAGFYDSESIKQYPEIKTDFDYYFENFDDIDIV